MSDTRDDAGVDALDVRTVERVVEPEEWVRYDPARVFEIATWLAERGLRAEVRFAADAVPELWYFGGAGMSRPEPGQWLQVVNGGASLHTRTDSQLDNRSRYLPAGCQKRGVLAVQNPQATQDVLDTAELAKELSR